MTDDDGVVPEPPGPAAPPPAAKPAWMAFLLPGAVLVGALIVAAAILYVWRDDDSGNAPAGEGGTESTVASTAGLLETFVSYATELGMDASAFNACVRSDAPALLLNAHLQEGIDLGVNGTPTFVVNNKMLVGSQPIEVLEEIVDAELAGSPDSVDGYSPAIQALAASGRFSIIDGAIDLAGAEFEGSPEAEVVIVEFSDFQCPFCRRWVEDSLERLRARLGDEVALAFMHFPIMQIHPNAGNAGAVAICAGEQGKFWEMHDLLFARQAEWQDLR